MFKVFEQENGRMEVTVKQLIEELQKHPENNILRYQAYNRDSSVYLITGKVESSHNLVTSDGNRTTIRCS